MESYEKVGKILRKAETEAWSSKEKRAWGQQLPSYPARLEGLALTGHEKQKTTKRCQF